MESESAEEEIKEDSGDETVYYMLPSPLQIAHIFRKSGLTYFPDITNESENASKYVSETSKLQNLGVYTADLCYVALNRQTQEELTYFKTIMDMCNEMGFSSIFSSAAFVDRFEENVSNEDSMIVILAELQERLDYYLQEAEMEDKSTIIFSGAWIESMYISLAGYKLEGESSGLSLRIYEQLNILTNLIGKLNTVYDQNDEVKSMINDLNALQFMAKNLSFIKEVEKKKHVLLKEVSLSDKELDQLVDKVDEIRSKIVNAE